MNKSLSMGFSGQKKAESESFVRAMCYVDIAPQRIIVFRGEGGDWSFSREIACLSRVANVMSI